VEQSPKDPPPPRQSDRKRRYQAPNTPTLDRMLESSPHPSSENEKVAVSKNQQWQKLAAAIAVVGQPISALESPSAELHADEVDDETKTGHNSKKGIPKRKTRNVGGWVSPMFSNQIDRSWLDSDEIESSLSIYTYVPQPGDIVL
jgi:cytoskeletal protein RodZ